MLKYCPVCNSRYSVANNSGDFVHVCNNPEAIEVMKKEDILRYGSSEEFGNTVPPPLGTPFLQGTWNELFGTRAGVEGGRFTPVDIRGNKVSVNRSRDRYTYLE